MINRDVGAWLNSADYIRFFFKTHIHNILYISEIAGRKTNAGNDCFFPRHGISILTAVRDIDRAFLFVRLSVTLWYLSKRLHIASNVHARGKYTSTRYNYWGHYYSFSSPNSANKIPMVTIRPSAEPLKSRSRWRNANFSYSMILADHRCRHLSQRRYKLCPQWLWITNRKW